MSRELQYLRDELNQSLRFFNEHPQKTVNMVLLLWGGASIIFGTKLFEFDNAMPYFLLGTIFFLSNFMLHFSVRRVHDNMKGIVKIAAYITVFYEKRPSKDVKIGVDNNISWEIANTELEPYVNRKHEVRKNDEYLMLMAFSTLVIFVSTVLFFQICELKECFKVLGLLISGLYIFTSLWLLYRTYGLLKGFSSIKEDYIKAFFQYSLDTGHYTKEEIEERFGDFWRKVSAKPCIPKGFWRGG